MSMEIRTCPMCGKQYSEHPAISRTKGLEEICPNCGVSQALMAYQIATGKTCITREANEWMNRMPERQALVKSCLGRHIHFDWGDMDDEDWAINDRAASTGERLFSAYNIPIELMGEGLDDKLWIITEADGSSTTILFPSEY